MSTNAVQALSAQLHAAFSAPIPFVIVVAAMTVAVWRVLVWRYAGLIEGLEERLKRRDDEIAEVKRKLSEAEKASQPAQAPDTNHDQRLAAVKQMQAALTNTARARVASRVYDGLEAATPELHAAMLTASKVFALTRPVTRPGQQKPTYALDLGKWLTEMLPLVRAGHINEARSRAEELKIELSTSRYQ